MPRANPQQNKKYYSCDPRQTHGDFHNKIGHEQTSAALFGSALLSWPNLATEVKRAINDADVTVSLWKIAQHSAFEGIKFLCQQANVVATREQTVKQPASFRIATLQDVIVDEPKTADQKCSFAAWQAINRLCRFVTQNEFIVEEELLLDGLKRTLNAGIIGWQEPHDR
jgi:hypothetical protein